MSYPTTSETIASLNYNNVEIARSLLALQDAIGANDKTITSVAAQAGAGSTGTTTKSSGSSVRRGQITVTPGGSGIAAGAMAIVTPSALPAGWAQTASGIAITDLSGVASADGVLPYVTLGATTWSLCFAVAPTTAHVYVLGYILVA